MGAGRARPARAGGAGALRRARLRADHGGRDRRARAGSPSARSSATSPTSARCCSPAARRSSRLLVDGARRRARRRRRRSRRSRAALEAAGAMLEEPPRGRPRSGRRVIAANAELRERELIKLASVAAALADGAARARRGRAGREPGRRDRHRGLPGRVRALGGRGRDARPARDRARVRRRSARRGRLNCGIEGGGIGRGAGRWRLCAHLWRAKRRQGSPKRSTTSPPYPSRSWPVPENGSAGLAPKKEAARGGGGRLQGGPVRTGRGTCLEGPIGWSGRREAPMMRHRPDLCVERDGGGRHDRPSDRRIIHPSHGSNRTNVQRGQSGRS